MPRPLTTSRLVNCQYYIWRVFRDREGTWQADGRSNGTNRRPTLGTGTFDEAISQLGDYDHLVAVELGRAPRNILTAGRTSDLSIAEAWGKYLVQVEERKATHEVSQATPKRYRPIGDKFLDFCRRERAVSIAAISDGLLRRYLGELDNRGYEYGTRYIEATTIKQFVRFLIEERHLPESARLRVKMPKPTESSTYCYTEREMDAILNRCQGTSQTMWLYPILYTLAWTGLRISEVRQLRWTDLDFERGMINLKDERFARMTSVASPRTLKGKYSRSLPMADCLRDVLEKLSRHPDGYVFHGARGARIKPDRVRRVLIRDILVPLQEQFPTPEGAILGFADGRIHSFRHFFVSMAANSGTVTEQMLLTWLGHRSSQLIRRYYHLHDHVARDAINSVDWSNRQDSSRS